MWTPSCRLALHRVYGVQRTSRRTFLTNPKYHLWPSPVFFGKIPNKRGVVEIPHEVTTVHPAEITGENFFEISTSSLNTSLDFRRINPTQSHDPHGPQYGDQMTMKLVRFPPDLKGFLYHYSPPNQNPLGGGLRFRIAETPDREGFLTGHDLLTDHGIPWSIPIWQICTRPRYRNFLALLEKDGFAPPEMVLSCKKMHIDDDSVVITALGQPWTVEWSWAFSRVYFVAPATHPVPALVHMPWHYRHSVLSAPYTGKGVVSLVRHPDGKFGLRVDKVLHLRQVGINLNTVTPQDGIVTDFNCSLIIKSTKTSTLKQDAMVGQVMRACRHLPQSPENPSPLDVYQHTPLSPAQFYSITAPYFA